jgi:hypothetical protein
MAFGSRETNRICEFGRDPHAPRRRKRRFLARLADFCETPPLIYTLQTLLR